MPGEIMKSILPEEEHEAIPTGFTQVGHVCMTPLALFLHVLF